ncbi:MAG: phosphate-starvation-inducible PsiE family protein [Methanospirillum sp.]|uniref:phosphate-starvation-inducible PsiE family protein n=1 Tax=Methanospirillum sp. TaxID=45200 RepID=UPI00236F7DA7|nr:phosphate-starvation-inducible PsiE family protein [Methanospirillum sp.]MDD1730396.1 phosphate-starvation-inducible PsiE family protein [Methanospirillum sp.]
MQTLDLIKSYKPEEISWVDFVMVLLIFFSMTSFIFIGILNLVSVYMSIYVFFCGFEGPISDTRILGIISTTLLTIIIVELYITVKELKYGNIDIKLILIIGLTAIIRHFILLISQDFSEKDVFAMIGLAVVMMFFIFGLWIVKSRNIDSIANIWAPVEKK